ncbi:hypothetical protein ACHAQH_000485 [Verticillium albo-atrum]
MAPITTTTTITAAAAAVTNGLSYLAGSDANSPLPRQDEFASSEIRTITIAIVSLALAAATFLVTWRQCVQSRSPEQSRRSSDTALDDVQGQDADAPSSTPDQMPVGNHDTAGDGSSDGMPPGATDDAVVESPTGPV